ncbi:Aste57867_24384 [Aphanomyces stellatus]|uniref:RING-type E3 ubiquitin transferase n=1 Tax=Aphanomyces stellatus TaxID=120398 RepID=A0A485LQ72_9STRA|nr:hypothetical protein As57867_024308 [Aphanomyces stellatus]VFU01024.1 Aste57867_24384 [Aphanomyces stellatus]
MQQTSHKEPSTAAMPPPPAPAAMPDDGSHDFDCNICLDRVKEPVVTLCGHLYWYLAVLVSGVYYSCWISTHNQCPVCKAGVTHDNVIPVYGRGSKSIDPRKEGNSSGLPLEEGVPDRPRGQRPEPVPRRGRHAFGLDSTQEVAFSPMIGFFPSLFGLQFQHATQPLPHATHPMTQADAQQRVQHVFLSRFLLLVGTFVLLCLVMF